MIRGQYDDFQTILDPSHAAAVAGEIARGFQDYFERYAKHALVGLARFKKGLRGQHSSLVMDPQTRLRQRTDEAILEYESQRRDSYDCILDAEVLEEYAEDPNQFVRDFLKKLPIINNARNAKLEDMEPWKRRLHMAFKQDPRANLALVGGLVEFAADFPRLYVWENLLGETDPACLPFAPLENPYSQDGAMPRRGGLQVAPLCLPGTIGLGITSALLHFREPALLPWRSRFALTGLHFLSGQCTGALETPEFVLWDVRSGSCYSNYTYLYAPFFLHVARVAALLQEAAKCLGVPFPESHRMVIAGDFLKFVADENLSVTKDWAPEMDAGGCSG